MQKSQHQLLRELAKRLKKEKRSKEDIISFFKRAHIFDEKDDFSDNYKHLRKVVTTAPAR